MVDTMARPFDWDHDQYAPRHAPYSPRGKNPQALHLPPPSSLVSGAHYSEVALGGREHAFHNQSSYQDIHVPVASMSAHRSAQAPVSGPEGNASTFDASSRRLVDTKTRLSSTYSSPSSERSEEQPDSFSLRPLTQDQMTLPARRLPPYPAHMYESPPQQPHRLEIQPVGRPQDVQPPNTGLITLSQTNSPAHQWRPPQPELRPPEPRMKIADLLSTEEGSVISRPPESPGRTQRRSPMAAAVTSAYRIRIRQQPVAARSCGYGERDRRVIDPPPIIQMSIEDPTASEEEIRSRLTQSYYIMLCTIWNESGDEDMSSMPEDYRTQRRLMGTVVSSPFAGNDENDEYGCFFCFPDLSCRTPGAFRLQFSFMVLDPASTPGHRTPVVALAMSDVFTVYNAKDFPGMKASTALTKRLKEQGCLISIKKGNDRARVRGESESGEEYEEDATGASSRERPKRVKKT